jgi:Fe-S oxidoreductase
MIEEFLKMLADKGELDLKFNEGKKKLLLHGHTFQRALIGTGAALEVLDLPPGYETKEMGGGCCGMAGAFGYEKEHYSIAQQIAKRGVFPEMEAHPDHEIVVAGVSCYQMLSEGTKRPVRHLIEVLREAVE